MEENMKRFLSVIAIMLVALLAVGCGAPAEEPAPTPEPTEGAALKTGFAVINLIAKSKDAGEEAGLAQADSTVVGVLVDADGVIVKCVIDGVQTKVNFDATGKISTPLDTIVPTKIELGTDYGMGKVSSLGKEWSEQIVDFAAYVEGKTLEEVKAIAVDETTMPTDEELASEVTIKIGGYVAAIEKAVNSATEMGAMEGDTLGLGITTSIAKSMHATADAEGLAQAYSTFTLASFNADGVITSAIIDGSQCNINFDNTGKLTTALDKVFVTKNELGDEYGMKGNSGIGAEWNTQAAAFAAHITGMTADEVAGIALNEEDAPADEELASQVTVGVDGFLACVASAAATAK